ncbi:MAG: hypothetical protein J6S85_09060 [Methanobrevibacter sp.]|nr:hypothetical protein [Methanobrevibacter sp.]
MKEKVVELSKIKKNQANPRTIRDDKYKKLMNSLLIFPKMLKARPIVVDKSMTVLGGNMRLRVLQDIITWSEEELKERLSTINEWKEKKETERIDIFSTWQNFIDTKKINVLIADDYTDSEAMSFIIKDNNNYGQWDYEMLNDWDSEKLQEWGIDQLDYDTTFDAGDELPEELQGIDINPDDLPKIVGDDNVAMERVIIVYPKERESEIANLLGIESVDKVIYDIKEIIPE